LREEVSNQQIKQGLRGEAASVTGLVEAHEQLVELEVALERCRDFKGNWVIQTAGQEIVHEAQKIKVDQSNRVFWIQYCPKKVNFTKKLDQ